ncbi:MAG: M1 family metallopeptidase [Cyclobacteriaceae bacterium]|nr:M1 family metallopeptidase [Cyclobacteriaceae bacterium]
MKLNSLSSWLTLCVLFLASAPAFAQPSTESGRWQGKFEQLDQLLPTPNEYRSGSGSPGPRYWQQRADYAIKAELDDNTQRITGSETITYHNNSPDALTYLWLQVDQNIYEKSSMTAKTQTNFVQDSTDTRKMAQDLGLFGFDGGFKIKSITDASGNPLPYKINYTMMRVDLPQPLGPGKSYTFKVDWWFNINDRMQGITRNSLRSGLEYFPEDGNYSYIIGQWFPRMCVYDDVVGWQNKQFLGYGEFTLTFGNYDVDLTVPADHIVAATGMIQNPTEVLTPQQLERFELAKKSFDKPVIIATQAEAIQREKTRAKDKKTWKFKAENVRDFAFATSRKFIWDAMAVKIGDKTPLAMSYYPKEGNPLWEQESTKAVRATLITYSKHTIDYPYPHATSVHHASIGMEYPMICFNGSRPRKDGTYSEQTKWSLVGVVIHEVGHNFFPMIINSDERQWTWMDEGLNSFVQYLTEREFYPEKPTGRGPASNVIPYMKGSPDVKRPLMTNSEEIPEFGAEQYGKTATAMNILRETVMGRELFDKAFKEYAQRWAFRHPKPADLFRTLEDASAVDLDWFWRGWFYTTDYCDQTIEQVKWYKVRNESSPVENKGKKVSQGEISGSGGAMDFSAGPQPFSVVPTDERLYRDFLSRVDDKAIISRMENKNFYEVTLTNKGGLMMPVIIEWTYKDGTKELEKIPAEIWRMNETKVTKVFMKEKEVVRVVLDPQEETSDINAADNVFPRPPGASKFDELKKKK